MVLSERIKAKLFGKNDRKHFSWLERKISKKARLAESTVFYKGFNLNSVTYKEGDCILINIGFTPGFIETDQYDVARILECFDCGKKDIVGEVKVQWFTHMDKIRKSHLKYIPKDVPDVDSFSEVAKDQWAYECIIDIETITGPCWVEEVLGDVDPSSIAKSGKSSGPLYVCRFIYQKSSPYIIPMGEKDIYLKKEGNDINIRKEEKDYKVQSSFALMEITNSPQRMKSNRTFTSCIKYEYPHESTEEKKKRSVKRKLLGPDEEEETRPVKRFKNEIECSKSPLSKNLSLASSLKKNELHPSPKREVVIDSPLKSSNILDIGQCRGLRVNEISHLLVDDIEKMDKQPLKLKNKPSKGNQNGSMKSREQNNIGEVKDQSIKDQSNCCKEENISYSDLLIGIEDEIYELDEEEEPIIVQEKTQDIKSIRKSLVDKSKNNHKLTAKQSCESEESTDYGSKIQLEKQKIVNKLCEFSSGEEFTSKSRSNRKSKKKYDESEWDVGTTRRSTKKESTKKSFRKENDDSDDDIKRPKRLTGKTSAKKRLSKVCKIKGAKESEESSDESGEEYVPSKRNNRSSTTRTRKTQDEDSDWEGSTPKKSCRKSGFNKRLSKVCKIKGAKESEESSDESGEEYVPSKRNNRSSTTRTRKTQDEDSAWEGSTPKKSCRKSGFNKRLSKVCKIKGAKESEESSDESGEEYVPSKRNNRSSTTRTRKAQDEDSDWEGSTPKKSCRKSGFNKRLSKVCRIKGAKESEESSDESGEEYVPSKRNNRSSTTRTRKTQDEESDWGGSTPKKSCKKSGFNKRLSKVCRVKGAKESEESSDESGEEYVPSKRNNQSSTTRTRKTQDEESDWEGSTPKKSCKKSGFNKSKTNTPRTKKGLFGSAETPGKKTPKRTPARSKKATPLPKLPSRETPVVKGRSEFEQAKAQLHVSTVPSFLPCREEEFQQIYSFVEGKLLDSTGGCMYVSGVPGTGKTATVREVVRLLMECEKEGTIPEFKFLEVNAMKLTKPQQLWVQIWEGISGQRVTADHAFSLFERSLKSSSGPKRKNIFLLLDELDLLWTKKQDVMYNLFDLSGRIDSRLIVVTIANTMDLPERMMISRVSSRLGLTRMTFHPYTFQQLQEIITSRLQGIKAFDPDAIQLVARKVAAVSGDARRALDICRRATELAELKKIELMSSPLKSPRKVNVLVGMPHVTSAIDEMFSSPKIMAIRRCSEMEKNLLQSILMEFTRTGIEEAELKRVIEHLQSVCRLEGWTPPNQTEVMKLISGLSAQRIIFIEHCKLDLALRIRLNISTDDVSYALSL